MLSKETPLTIQQTASLNSVEQNTIQDIEFTQTSLSQITNPAELQNYSVSGLEKLATEIRETIIQTVSQNGGHLAPSLGVVELTLALLNVFDINKDKIIWDVGHQSYAYKLLTGRYNQFHSLRQYKGISGFPSRTESPFDHFGTGHASTSISAALGIATARDIQGSDEHIISVIGDGALTTGLAFEGLNHAGSRKKPFIVILNDNEMSISKNVGALSLFMSQNLSARWVRRVKKEVEGFLKSIPSIGDDLFEIAKRSKHSFKNFFTPGILFEALNFNYIGVVNGHDVASLQKVLKLAKTIEKPVLIHVFTQKGKGYSPAESNPVKFHGVGSFNITTGTSATSSPPSFSAIFGKALCDLAEEDQKITAITAAMTEGTGLLEFSQRFPERFFDVGICEGHAVTFAGGLASQGLKPFVAIYSTFLQRAYDQIVHDICLQKLPVVFCIDRASLVGEDGATHHGVFDISYLRHIPNIRILTPRNDFELKCSLLTASKTEGPIAIRYPRGTSPLANTDEEAYAFDTVEAEWIYSGKDIAILSYGASCQATVDACDILRNKGIDCALINPRWIKPLPEKDLKKIALQFDKLFIVEEHILAGGFSSAVLEYYLENDLLSKIQIKRIGINDVFVEHGSVKLLQSSLGLSPENIVEQILALVNNG